MSSSVQSPVPWLKAWMRARGVELWGAADLSGLERPTDGDGNRYPRAVSWVYPMPPHVMAAIHDGPNRAYAEAYSRANTVIDRTANDLTAAIRARGFRALPLAASDRTDPDTLRGDFPHKTASTLAGLGWVGRNCQLVTPELGPWVRLGTVFTDLPLPTGRAVDRSRCGSCMECVDACPTGALTGGEWAPGIDRAMILDAWSCDRWKQENYSEFNDGHNCGICTAVCPIGRSSVG
jgi:epoxyqueuosine reductase QueG